MMGSSCINWCHHNCHKSIFQAILVSVRLAMTPSKHTSDKHLWHTPLAFNPTGSGGLDSETLRRARIGPIVWGGVAGGCLSFFWPTLAVERLRDGKGVSLKDVWDPSLEMGYFSGSSERIFGCMGTLDLCVLRKNWPWIGVEKAVY